MHELLAFLAVGGAATAFIWLTRPRVTVTHTEPTIRIPTNAGQVNHTSSLDTLDTAITPEYE